MTSNPLMNKKKMLNQVAGFNSEKDKLTTFQTPMPQMRFANRGSVDSRLSKLLGAERKNIGGGIVMNNLAGQYSEPQEEQNSFDPKALLGFSNNLANKLNQLQSKQPPDNSN